MRAIKHYLLAIILLLSPMVLAFSEETAKADLQNILRRSFDEERFVIQISSVFRKLSEAKLLDREVMQNSLAREKLALPPNLPGFDIELREEAEYKPAEFKREFFINDDQEKLVKLNIQVFYDHNFSTDDREYFKKIINAYLSNQATVQYALSFTPFVPKPESKTPRAFTIEHFILLGLAGILLLLCLVWILWRILRKKNLKSDIENEPRVTGAGDVSLKHEELPTQSEEFKRNYLFEQFLHHPEAFRTYYFKCSQPQRSALSKLLSGTAFHEILHILDLDVLKESSDVISGEEAFTLNFFIRDFSEFIKTFMWQRSLFFGFLAQYSPETLIAFFSNVDAQKGAVVARFLSASSLGSVFAAIPAQKRRQIIKEAHEAASLSLSEISKIESEVRDTLSNTPSAGSDLMKSDFKFFTDLVNNSEDQDAILADIHAAAPSVYDELSKLRFNLEDIPSLSSEINMRVIQELDNKQLSLALIGLPADIANYLLDFLPENRRALIVSQRASLSRIPTAEVKAAQKELAALYKKELS